MCWYINIEVESPLPLISFSNSIVNYFFTIFHFHTFLQIIIIYTFIQI